MRINVPTKLPSTLSIAKIESLKVQTWAEQEHSVRKGEKSQKTENTTFSYGNEIYPHYNAFLHYDFLRGECAWTVFTVKCSLLCQNNVLKTKQWTRKKLETQDGSWQDGRLQDNVRVRQLKQSVWICRECLNLWVRTVIPQVCWGLGDRFSWPGSLYYCWNLSWSD